MGDLASLGFSALIVRRESGTEDEMVFLEHEPGDYDPENMYVEHVAFEVYGVPEDMDDAVVDEAVSGTMQGIPHVAQVRGAYVPCEQILNDGEDPYTICDDISAELEFIMSILTGEGGPLNDEDGDSYRDVFCIDEIEIAEEYKEHDLVLIDRILKELPYLIKRFMHQTPQIIAYYPAPTKNDWYEQPHNRLAVSGLLMEKVDKMFTAIRQPEADDEATVKHISEDGKIKRFPGEYNFNEDDINYVLGRRKSDDAYPEELKDRRIFELYERNGFGEINETRLLVLLAADDLE